MSLNPAAGGKLERTFRPERIRSDYAGQPPVAAAAEQFQREERERHVLRVLWQHGLMPLARKRILEVGCGTGKWLRDLVAWGADPERLVGVELLQATAARARRLCPQRVTIECGNAAELRFEPASFDIVFQASVFTTVLDPDMKHAMAAEMLRVVRPGGAILWYDSFLKSPANPYVLPVLRQEIRDLFPGCSLELRRVTLASPLTRFLAPRAWAACSLLSGIPALCTHYLGVIRKRGVSQ